MCDPQATAQLGLTLDTGAGIFGAVSSYRAAEIDQAVARNNAQLAEMQAKDALTRGADAELRLRKGAARLRGSQTARFAAGNVQLQGSALDILEETDRMADADAAVIRRNAGNEAWARRTEAAGYRARADGINPGAAGFTSLLSSAGRVADRWSSYADRY